MKFKISFPLLFFLCLCAVSKIELMPFLISYAVHESGHMAAVRLFGGDIREIRADVKGIELKMDKRGFFKRHEIILINLAGPLAGLLLALTAYFIGEDKLFRLNAALSLFSLLPLPGLDGGEILSQIKNTADL